MKGVNKSIDLVHMASIILSSLASACKDEPSAHAETFKLSSASLSAGTEEKSMSLRDFSGGLLEIMDVKCLPMVLY